MATDPSGYRYVIGTTVDDDSPWSDYAKSSESPLYGWEIFDYVIMSTSALKNFYYISGAVVTIVGVVILVAFGAGAAVVAGITTSHIGNAMTMSGGVLLLSGVLTGTDEVNGISIWLYNLEMDQVENIIIYVILKGLTITITSIDVEVYVHGKTALAGMECIYPWVGYYSGDKYSVSPGDFHWYYSILYRYVRVQ